MSVLKLLSSMFYISFGYIIYCVDIYFPVLRDVTSYRLFLLMTFDRDLTNIYLVNAYPPELLYYHKTILQLVILTEDQ